MRSFVFESGKCIGCKACQMACKDKNNLEVGTFFRRVETFEQDGKTLRYSGACNHCDSPLCVEGCPTGAMYLADDSTIQHHDGKCIACGACIWNCPFGAPTFSAQVGTVRKCDACADLLAHGENPACVAACLTHCLHYRELTEPEAKRQYADYPDFLPPHMLTHPSVYIEGRRERK